MVAFSPTKLLAILFVASVIANPVADADADPVAPADPDGLKCPTGKVRCCPGGPCTSFIRCKFTNCGIPRPCGPCPKGAQCLLPPCPPPEIFTPVIPEPVVPTRGLCKPCNAPKGMACPDVCIPWDD